MIGLVNGAVRGEPSCSESVGLILDILAVGLDLVCLALTGLTFSRLNTSGSGSVGAGVVSGSQSSAGLLDNWPEMLASLTSQDKSDLRPPTIFSRLVSEGGVVWMEERFRLGLEERLRLDGRFSMSTDLELKLCRDDFFRSSAKNNKNKIVRPSIIVNAVWLLSLSLN